MTENANRLSNGNLSPDKKRTAGMALATVLMIIGLTLSKSTGFLREIFIMFRLGSGTVEADAFYLGFNIPDLFFSFLLADLFKLRSPPLWRVQSKSAMRREGGEASVFLSQSFLF